MAAVRSAVWQWPQLQPRGQWKGRYHEQDFYTLPTTHIQDINISTLHYMVHLSCAYETWNSADVASWFFSHCSSCQRPIAVRCRLGAGRRKLVSSKRWSNEPLIWVKVRAPSSCTHNHHPQQHRNLDVCVTLWWHRRPMSTSHISHASR